MTTPLFFASSIFSLQPEKQILYIKIVKQTYIVRETIGRMRDKGYFGHEEKENTSDAILFAGVCAAEEKRAYKYRSKVF